MCNSNNEDNFKKKFKYYKSKKDKPSFENVMIFGSVQAKEELYHIQIPDILSFKDSKPCALGLSNPSTWSIYSLKSPEGLVVIRNPFTTLGQRYWIRQCLENFPRKPNKTNIDFEGNIEDWWRESFANNVCNKNLQKKLRWTTIGYHHNWDTKIYSELNKSDFPRDLASLCDVVAQFLGHRGFRAEAAIVNYYHMDSTLSPHTDHSEVNLEAPLFSFSFGQSAIFLIGGADKSVEPTALLLRSGDVVVMTGPARLAYHAVPKIIPSSDKAWNDINGMETLKSTDNLQNVDFNEWSAFNDYIRESRININVRQVLRENQSSLLESI